MELNELHDRLASDVAYPLDADALVAALDDGSIDAPDGSSESIRTVLSRTDTGQFESATEAYEAVVGNLSDAHIGRKYYDDRGGNPQSVEDVSF